MITIVLIIAVAIIAVLAAYGWWKTNKRIDYAAQCGLSDFSYFCERYDDLKCDVERINDLLNSANDGINSLTNQYNCEVDDIKSKIEYIEAVYIKRSNGLLTNANDRIKILTSRLDDIDARYKYLHDRLLTHCHAHNVENNTLYIQNPLWIDNTKEPKAIEKNEEG